MRHGWITVGIGATVILLALGAQPEHTTTTDQEPGPIRFRNVAEASGIDFTLENSPTERKHLIETMAGGVATFDYDGDGLTDIYFTNGAALPSLQKDAPKYQNRLYRNIGGFKFKDVTAQAGIAGVGYSIAAAAGDYDNDGHVDLFIAGVGKNILYRNRGDGTFEDVTAKAGIKDDPWSVGAAWLDYDNDGRLDLFVVNYVRWSPDFDRFCGDASGRTRVYCHPRFFEGLPNRLYHNEGNGTFKDVSAQSGIASHIGKGMSAAIADYDGDGRMDIFVANDKVPNFLFHNLGNGRFEETAFDAGVAFQDSGNEISNMGADFRDYDNDSRPDLAITALSGETFSLFRNRGKGQFADAGHTSGLATRSRVYAGWGIGLFDFNNDGWKDIFSANAHVNDRVELFEPTQYRQHNSVFLNHGDGTFQDVSAGVGPDFLTARAHRGCAFADFNKDGRVDVVVTSLGEPVEIWENISPNAGSWLLLHLVGTKSNRDGIGAEVRIGNQLNHMTTAVGYASSSYLGVHLGTGESKQVDEIEIKWPSGILQKLRHVRTNQILTVEESET
jgi:hypothetical protein